MNSVCMAEKKQHAQCTKCTVSRKHRSFIVPRQNIFNTAKVSQINKNFVLIIFRKLDSIFPAMKQLHIIVILFTRYITQVPGQVCNIMDSVFNVHHRRKKLHSSVQGAYVQIHYIEEYSTLHNISTCKYLPHNLNPLIRRSLQKLTTVPYQCCGSGIIFAQSGSELSVNHDSGSGRIQHRPVTDPKTRPGKTMTFQNCMQTFQSKIFVINDEFNHIQIRPDQEPQHCSPKLGTSATIR